MKRKTNTSKKRVKTNVEAGIAHIRSTFNNKIETLTDTHGNALHWSSAGAL
ncbi:30S ribosomal protein S11, partial [Bacillus nitratireducens]|uniref:30S ribosomal protein S11 n=1 Tax=Bacillus nitratireducens TaxID=2026193 RepID=UPI00283F48FF